MLESNLVSTAPPPNAGVVKVPPEGALVPKKLYTQVPLWLAVPKISVVVFAIAKPVSYPAVFAAQGTKMFDKQSTTVRKLPDVGDAPNRGMGTPAAEVPIVLTGAN